MNKQSPPKGFDENRIWTEEMHARARPARDVLPPGAVEALTRKRGRPAGSKNEKRKEQIALRVDADVLAAYRAGGPGWQSRMNAALRKALEDERD